MISTTSSSCMFFSELLAIPCLNADQVKYFTFRDCNSQPNNDLDSQAITNPLQNSNSINNEAGEHYRSNQTILGNINNRNRNDGNIGLSEHASTYFSNNIDNHQPEQQLNHRTNEGNSNSKGKNNHFYFIFII